jgi:hypothetical protein
MLTNKAKTAILVSIMAVFVTAGWGTLYCRAGEQPRDVGKVRPITEAETVLAVYRENLGVGSDGTPALIFAAWPDGYVVWSKDRVQGGAPYQSGNGDPQKIAALLARFGTDGLFADDKLNQAHFGPDSAFISVLIKSGKKQVKMRSWHELFEASDKLVVTSHGVESPDNPRRLEVLRKEPADYLFFRFVWSETRSRLTDLIPSKGTASADKPVMKVGELSWHETVAEGQREQKPRFKGVELYSWKDKDGEWVFVLLDGTNRLKTEDQVKGAKNQVRGAEGVKKALTHLAAGEQVSWMHRIKGFEFPPEATRKEIEKAAKETKIDLQTVGQRE